MNDIEMCSGIGQFHTNEPDPSKATKKLTEYLAIGRAAISQMADKPQQVTKEKAQWLIPSNHMPLLCINSRFRQATPSSTASS
jgi:hypothetical protein